MTNQRLAHLRLHHQRLAGKLFAHPTEVVRWLGALQAQDYQQALWAIGQRTQAATRTDVERAIAERRIVRTWPMRGTLHFVAAENTKWMLEFLAARPLAAAPLRHRRLELDDRILGHCRDVFQAALSGGKRQTRLELMQRLADAGLSPQGQRGYHLLWYWAHHGLICLGPVQDKEQTFVLLDEWVPAAVARQLTRGEALAELATTYFTSRGPASIHDFAGWAGLTLTDARAGLEEAKAGLASEKRGTKQYWWAPDAPGMLPLEAPGLCLLPGFDEYLLGYKDRSEVLAAEHAQKIVPGNNGVFLPTIVRDGQVVGTWKRSFRKTAVDVSLAPFASLDVTPAELAVAVRRFSDFVELPLASGR